MWCTTRTTAEYVRNYNLSYQNCVQGYNPAVDGTIVVTRGDRIVASNDTSLLDTTVDDNPTLSALKARSTDGGMIHVHSTTGQQYAYGIVGQGRSFYIYVYRPEQEVYVSTMRNVSMAAFTYMVLLFLAAIAARQDRPALPGAAAAPGAGVPGSPSRRLR